MSAHVFILGQFLEVVIVAEHVVSVEGILNRDRAGQIVLQYVDASLEMEPTFSGSAIQLSTGSTITVPQRPDEVADLMAKALERKAVLPANWPAS